jgi:hypothetical protein
LNHKTKGIEIKLVMAHQIERIDTTFSVYGGEWHGKANKVDVINEETIGRIIDFEIQEKVLLTAERDEETGLYLPETIMEVEGSKVVIADLSGRDDLLVSDRRSWPLHTPRDSYRVITNREVWDCLNAAIEGIDGVKIVTAGTLDWCKKFYLSLELDGGKDLKTATGDKFQAVLNLLTSHDGTLNLLAMDSMTRTVCMNTFRYNVAYDGGAMKVRIPHTKNAGIQIDNLATYLNTVLAGRLKVMDSMNHLENIKMESPSHAAYVAAGFFTSPDADEMSTRSFNRSIEIRDLAVTGKGNHGKTRADMLNGFTEYFTHHAGAGGEKADKAKRWSVSTFGAAADHKEGFLNLLLNDSDYSEALDRGEKLFKDKEQALLAA